MIQVLPHFKPLWQRYRYKVAFSGRGSAKSFHFSGALSNIASRAKIRATCFREYQNSISESSKAQIESLIEASGTWNAWDITNNTIEHKVTRSLIMFKGLQNVESVKSTTDLDLAWVEECETMSQHSINLLIPTLRKDGSQIWLSGNPRDRLAPVAQLFIENERPPSTVVITNSYLDNIFCPKTLIAEAEYLKQTNPTLYNHIYLGQYLDVGNLIMVPRVVHGGYIDQHKPKCVVGVDIAKDGGDKTVIAVRIGRYFPEIREFATMNDSMLVAQLQDVIRRYKPNRINVDSTGHGAWVPELLKASGIEVKGINFASTYKDGTKFSNTRTGLYGLMNEYFAKGGTIPEHAIELEKQICASYYTLDNRNRVKMLPKEEVKRRVGCSPDQADAVGLALVCDGDMFVDETDTNTRDNDLVNIALINEGYFEP